MSEVDVDHNLRILLIDDNAAIHDDFRKVLKLTESGVDVLDEDEAFLFGDGAERVDTHQFELESAYQGKDGFTMVQKAVEAGRPYALAFVDVRMPPGWDGIETIARLWEMDDELQTVICTAYSDYSWEEMIAKLGQTDRLLILKKPFDNIEILQMAYALTAKWNLARKARLNMEQLERMAQDLAEQRIEQALREQFTVSRNLETLKQLFDKSPLAEGEQQLFSPTPTVADQPDS